MPPKTLVVDLTLDKHILQEVLSKNVLKPAVRREVVKGVREAYQLSEKRACGLMGITRWSTVTPAGYTVFANADT